MLPKEERRAMVLYIFNDSIHVNNNSMKNQTAPQKQAETMVDAVEAPATIEENLLKNKGQISFESRLSPLISFQSE